MRVHPVRWWERGREKARAVQVRRVMLVIPAVLVDIRRFSGTGFRPLRTVRGGLLAL
ncbi:MAG: hypothetical protein HC884_14020 [Chloroflexaceae bacterium]|nr:hypothetical protein [Chloroflexaceae bacterium]